MLLQLSLPMYATSFHCSFFFSTIGLKTSSGSSPTSITSQPVLFFSWSAIDWATGSSLQVNSTTWRRHTEGSACGGSDASKYTDTIFPSDSNLHVLFLQHADARGVPGVDGQHLLSGLGQKDPSFRQTSGNLTERQTDDLWRLPAEVAIPVERSKGGMKAQPSVETDKSDF